MWILVLRLALCALSAPLAWGLMHAVWYAAPKAVKRTAWGDAILPGSFAFYDQTNMPISLTVSTAVAVVAPLVVWVVWGRMAARRLGHRAGFPVLPARGRPPTPPPPQPPAPPAR